MIRDIEELYNNDKSNDSCSENDIVINEAMATLHLMCEQCCQMLLKKICQTSSEIMPDFLKFCQFDFLVKLSSL